MKSNYEQVENQVSDRKRKRKFISHQIRNVLSSYKVEVFPGWAILLDFEKLSNQLIEKDDK